MVPFLRQIANHYYKSGADMSRMCFIFPNRRSMAFFRKHLADAVKEDGNAIPVVAPIMLTMNDFFYAVSLTGEAGRVTLLLELYDCYKELNSKAESLDDFIFWGDVILGDFDDVDKYLADPRRLYTNIADFKEIQDSYSYLTAEQLDAINRFISHFRDGGKLTVNLDSDNPDVKGRFLQIWNILYPLYDKFNKVLSDKNLAYEGMAYRRFAERLKTDSAVDILADVFPVADKFVFAGLNALNECEKTVMRKMRDAGIAEFCWDFSSEMIRDPLNRASMFMSKNVSEFPQSFSYEDDAVIGRPDINVLSVPSSVGQAKYLPEILKSIAAMKIGGDVSKVGRLDVPDADTAIVIPDESLLVPILNTIPLEITSVNVTMGYPMSGSEVYGLMNDISAMQLHLRKRAGGWAFYHKQVWAILSSGIVKQLLDDEGKERAARIKNEAKYYIPQEDLSGIMLFDLIFRPIVTDPKLPSLEQIRSFQDYQLEILAGIGAKIAKENNMALETHFAKDYYIAVNRLRDMSLAILPMTYVRLLQQLVGSISVPFKGEPLKGLQIMGPLEMRSLDFTNIIVLSCNEGVFPRRNVSSSFIPPELRKGFGLPTYENQDAVWSYYFFRMIQRASNVWLLYDSRTEGLKSGEESRYIKQLEYQYKYPLLTRGVVRSSISIPEVESMIPKTAEDLERVRTMWYSASSMQNWLACQAKFYYSSVKRLTPETAVSESLDNGMIGNVFHNTMYALYVGGEALSPTFEITRENVEANVKSPLQEISTDYIDSLLKNKELLKNRIRSLICAELKSEEVSGRNLVLEDLIYQYVVQTLETDKKLMRDAGVGSFKIVGLEQKRIWEFDGMKFIGYIDRMDSIVPGTVRIVDYKTGKVEEDEVKIDNLNAEKVVGALFAPVSTKRPSIALQLFLYDRFVAKDVAGKTVENVLYPVQKMFTSGILTSQECREFDAMVSEKLKDVFADILDPEKGFMRTEDTKVCGYCDFKKICGR